MADIPGWIKSFHRIRTPITGGLPSIEQCGYVGNPNVNEDDTNWPSNIHRVSSYLNLGRQKQPSTSSSYGPAQPAIAVDVWHNPDETQVVETLKVLLMNRDNFEPIPVQYNSCILQVLEAYGNMRQVLARTEKDLCELTNKQMKETHNFEENITILENKENDYKREIKNLEVMLATGARGLDVVTMARSKSLVYRPETRSKTEDSWNSAVNSESMTVDFATNRDRQVSIKFMRNPSGCYNSGQFHQQQHYGMAIDDPPPNKGDEELRRAPRELHLPHLRRKHQNLREKRALSSSSSSSEDKPLERRPCKAGGAGSNQGNSWSEVKVTDDDKPLPDLPVIPMKMVLKELFKQDTGRIHFQQAENRPTPQGARKRGFSFVPGDDCTVPVTEFTTSRATTYGLGVYSNGDEEIVEVLSLKEITKDHQSKVTGSTPSHGRHELSFSSDRKIAIEGLSGLERSHNSKSSVLTVIRDNYGSSSRNKGRFEGEIRKLNRQSAHDEATIAAVRAVSSKVKKTS